LNDLNQPLNIREHTTQNKIKRSSESLSHDEIDGSETCCIPYIVWSIRIAVIYSFEISQFAPIPHHAKPQKGPNIERNRDFSVCWHLIVSRMFSRVYCSASPYRY
jgi:hypothetical protein